MKLDVFENTNSFEKFNQGKTILDKVPRISIFFTQNW